MNRASLILLFAGSILFFSCNSSTENKAATDSTSAIINKDSLIHHIVVLSSDSFQGRRPFTAGETKTVDYLQQQCKQIGLQPGNGSSYLQDVPLMEVTPVGTQTMSVNGPKGKIDFKSLEDFVAFTETPDTLITVKNADVVFAGFGVVAPEYNWNDYAGLDVKGKVVMVMVNDPGFTIGDTSLFKGKTMTYYGRWTYKFEEAARQGAKGCLIIHNTAAASYPFNVVTSSNGGTKLHLDERTHPVYHCPVEGWVTSDAAGKILAAAGKDTSLYIQANKRGFHAQDLHLNADITLHTKVVFNLSHNIIATIPGSEKPNEYIIYTAHWDHLGVGKPDAKGDSIYNGALDNASGTAAVLEVARAFEKTNEKPKRTIVFLFVTAEEQGLLGSAYYAQHPVFPASQTVANINIDGINNIGRTKDISIAGEGQSSLEDLFSEEVKKRGRYIGKELHPEAGHYFRSDHFNFAKAGIPALTTGAGIDDVTRGKDYGKQQEDYYTDHFYHQPSDEYDAKTWDLSGGIEDTELLYEVGKRLAYGNEWPEWKTGSEFKALRKR